MLFVPSAGDTIPEEIIATVENKTPMGAKDNYC